MTYYYVVRVKDSQNTSGNSNQASSVPVDNLSPAAPSNLVLSDVTNDQGGANYLTWQVSASPDIVEQRVYRALFSGGYSTPLVILGPSVTFFTDTTATKGTTFYYVVRAYDGINQSANSNEVFGASTDNLAPAGPTGQSAVDTTGDNGGSITITWVRSTDDGGGANDVTLYRIYAQPHPAFWGAS
jgi:hypothetical protein